MKQVENVIVDNGVEKHRVQYMHSNVAIKTMVNRALFNLTDNIIAKINDNNDTITIVCDYTYNQAKSIILLTKDKELKCEFKKMA